jgi:hypothetical protein
MGEDIRAITTAKAPGAMGPYSQAIVAGDLVFCAGQLGLDPVSREIVSGDIKEQTNRVLDNLTAVLEAAGSGRRPRREDDGLPRGHVRVRRDERGLRRSLRAASAGAVDGPGREATRQWRTRRDRVHRVPQVNDEREKPVLPVRATGMFLGLWMAVLLTLAFFVVPALFASCFPPAQPPPSASP